MIFTAQRKFKGFTLIELLIVIAILGILAAAVLIAINPTKRQNQAKDTVTKSDMSSLLTALQAYYTAPGTGKYPTTASFTTTNTNPLVVNKDLATIPTPGANKVGANAAYIYTAGPAAGCDNGAGGDCTAASMYYPLNDQASTPNPDIWCWQSSTGKALVVVGGATAAACPAT